MLIPSADEAALVATTWREGAASPHGGQHCDDIGFVLPVSSSPVRYAGRLTGGDDYCGVGADHWISPLTARSALPLFAPQRMSLGGGHSMSFPIRTSDHYGLAQLFAAS